MDVTANALVQDSLKRSGSLDELCHHLEDAAFKEKSGLLRRVFTGSRRKKGKKVLPLQLLSPHAGVMFTVSIAPNR